jgi:hypothetical protein
LLSSTWSPGVCSTVLFVLERVLVRARSGGNSRAQALVTALGRGFTAAFTLLANQ